MVYGISSGKGSKTYYQDVKELVDGQQKTIVYLWKQFYIGIEQEFPGETYQNDSELFVLSILVLVVGAFQGSGKGYFKL